MSFACRTSLFSAELGSHSVPQNPGAPHNRHHPRNYLPGEGMVQLQCPRVSTYQMSQSTEQATHAASMVCWHHIRPIYLWRWQLPMALLATVASAARRLSSLTFTEWFSGSGRDFFFFLVSSTVPRESGLRMLSRASVTLIESRGPGGHLVSCRKQRPGKATLYPVVTQVSSQCWAVLLSCTSTGLERWSNSYEHCAARVGLSTHLQFQHTAEGESL